MKNYLYENHDVKGLVITEASKSQLQEGVLAKVKGPSFFLDGYSRNGRFYPESLWENALKNSETMETLSRGLMFGCIGHPKDYSLDELLESGKVSHKVTDIYIDKNSGEGMAEYAILDTPAGRILNTVLRSGSDMYVSTRAFGGFTNETKTKDGKKYKILDDSNFVIESIDFVIQPGFLETKPKLMEALAEDFAELKEKDEINHIECEDGLCGLNLTPQNEMVDGIEVKSEIDGKTEVSENADADGQGIVMFNRELVEGLSKEDIITMLENVVNENKILTESEDGGNNADDMMVSAKLMMNYVSYVELLTKLVRYNVEYEKHYDALIEFLDKDSKLTTDDMASLDQICDDVLKEKDVEESIINTCERIKELAEKINSDGEEDAKDKKDKEGKTEEPKEKDKEDTSAEVKAKGESIVDFMLNMKTQVVEKVELVQDEEAIRDLKGQLLQMKEATKFLTKKLGEEMDKEPKVEKVVETKTIIEEKIPDDIHEKMQSFAETEKSLQEQVQVESDKRSDLAEKYDEVTEKYSDLADKYTELQEGISEKEESDKAMFREILEDKQEEYDELKEELDNASSAYAQANKQREEAIQEAKVAVNELTDTKAKLYASLYRVDLKEVKSLMKQYNDKEIVEVLKKEEKRIIRQEPKVIEVPEYKPSSRKSDAKKSFLENLTR